EPAGMTTIGLSYSLVKISTKCAPALAQGRHYFLPSYSWLSNPPFATLLSTSSLVSFFTVVSLHCYFAQYQSLFAINFVVQD
ncbi:hypothetical protein ACV1DN_18800, partial [Aeromonas allosaccharophila]